MGQASTARRGLSAQAILALALVAGLAGGFLLALVVPLPQTWSQFSRQYAFDVIEQVSLASELRGGRHDDVRKRIEAQLPPYVLAMYRDPSLRSSSMGDPLVAIFGPDGFTSSGHSPK